MPLRVDFTGRFTLIPRTCSRSLWLPCADFSVRDYPRLQLAALYLQCRGTLCVHIIYMGCGQMPGTDGGLILYRGANSCAPSAIAPSLHGAEAAALHD